MDNTALLDLACDLVFQHGLAGSVRVKIGQARTRAGSYDPVTRTIRISAAFAAHSPEHVTRDIILHEIAHALVYARHGVQRRGDSHGPTWCRIAREIGARPEPYTSDDANAGPPAVEGVCPKCERVVDRLTRFPKQEYRHRPCGETIQYRRAQ